MSQPNDDSVARDETRRVAFVQLRCQADPIRNCAHAQHSIAASNASRPRLDGSRCPSAGISAFAESCCGTLEMELLYELPLQSRSATRAAVANAIETFDDVRRRHTSLDCMSPMDFELKHSGNAGFSPVPGVADHEGGDRIDRLEGFASLFGPQFYGLGPRPDRLRPDGRG